MQQNDLYYVFKEVITKNKLLETGEKVVLGLSGGADSMTLFDLLFRIKAEYKIKIIPVHINHLLREASTKEAECLAKEVSRKYGTDLIVLSSNIKKIAKQEKMGVEACGREIRRKILEKIADKLGAKKIALGHNMDDQAETVLFRITRGTGIKGLCGMHMTSGKYIRPLLFTKKDKIKSYAKEKGLFYIEDSSNYELFFDRNIIRHNILSEFNKINVKATVHITELSIKCQELNQFLIRKAEEEIYKYLILQNSNVMILKAEILNLDGFILKEVLRSLYEKFTGSISGIKSFHVDKFCKESFSRNFVKVQFPRDVVFTKSSDIIFVSKKDFNKPEYEIAVNSGVIPLPYGLGCIVINEWQGNLSECRIRGFKEGDVYRGEKFKNFLYEYGIPKVLRNLVPLLTIGNKVLYTPIFDGNEFFFRNENTFFKLNFFEGELYSKILKREK